MDDEVGDAVLPVTLRPEAGDWTTNDADGTRHR